MTRARDGWHVLQLTVAVMVFACGGGRDHRLVDQHRHRVEVAGMGFEAQPLRFERQGAGGGDRVVESG